MLKKGSEPPKKIKNKKRETPKKKKKAKNINKNLLKKQTPKKQLLFDVFTLILADQAWY